MCDHHEQHALSVQNTHFFDFLGIGNLNVIVILFITGFLGSFTHCIAMCGPFALSISEMRLMSLGPEKLTQRQKLLALFATPYYLGKATTYSLLGGIFYISLSALKNIPMINYLAFLLLMLISAAFMMMGISNSTSLGAKFSSKLKWLTGRIGGYVQAIGGQFGIRGFSTGMVLGLIPCGLVIVSITQAASYAQNVWIMLFAVFVFGIATIPGLFLVSFFGGMVLNSASKKIFRALYAAMMFYNAFLLLVYALKLV
jgi:sulfite exporter TauE/SafE